MLLNAFGSKRSRATEKHIVTIFYKDLLGDTLLGIGSDEFLSSITTLPLARQAPVVGATALFMWQGISMTTLIPNRKQVPNMTGDQNMFNAILNCEEGQGLRWTSQRLDYAKKLIKHIAFAFWPLNYKMRYASMFVFYNVAIWKDKRQGEKSCPARSP